MNMTDLATWGQLISSAAVLVTLVYLSIETKQTATLLRSESRQSLIEQDMMVLRTQVDIPELMVHRAIEDELTLEQKYRLAAYLMVRSGPQSLDSGALCDGSTASARE